MSHHGIVPKKASTIIAIDFGSHGTGFAYSLDGSPAAELFHDYPDAACKYPKTLTAILYENRRAVSIGWTARQEFLRLKDAAATSWQPLSTHRLITGFKLLLHGPSNPLVQELPPGISEVQVIADFLALFKKLIMSSLRSKLGPGRSHLVSDDSITYVVTVPSMWSDMAKGLMRDACVRGGLIRRDRPDSMVVALEPESAALWAQHAHVTSFDVKETIMVLDAGGGTVDWTVHHPIKRDGQVVLAEATVTRGEMLGSLQLDKAFREHFRSEVGEQAFDTWARCHEQELLQVMSQWESVKCLFGADSNETAQHSALHLQLAFSRLGLGDTTITIPPALHAIMSSVDKLRLTGKYGRDDSITLSYEAMRALFEPTISKIIAATKEQMRSAGRVDKVLLVGGFSTSPYLQQSVKLQLLLEPGLHGTKILSVEQPYAAVLRGAVLYGLNPSLIRERKARHSYGVRTAGPHVTGSPTKFWHNEKHVWYSSSLFQRFVEKGQSIECDEAVHHELIPTYSYQTDVTINIYVIDAPGARFTDDADPDTKKLGSLTVSFDAASKTSERVIDCAFHFGRAEIKVTATDLHSRRSVDMPVKFAAA